MQKMHFKLNGIDIPISEILKGSISQSLSGANGCSTGYTFKSRCSWGPKSNYDLECNSSFPLTSISPIRIKAKYSKRHKKGAESIPKMFIWIVVHIKVALSIV